MSQPTTLMRFGHGTADLVAGLAEKRTAVVCSESVWWRCHRRIISDVATLTHGVRVVHLMHSGKFTVHEPSEGLYRDEHGEPVWDGATS